MTEQESEIKRIIGYIRTCRKAGIDVTIIIDKSNSHLVLNALEEIQQYRALGTIEEIKIAMRFLRLINLQGHAINQEVI